MQQSTLWGLIVENDISLAALPHWVANSKIPPFGAVAVPKSVLISIYTGSMYQTRNQFGSERKVHELWLSQTAANGFHFIHRETGVVKSYFQKDSYGLKFWSHFYSDFQKVSVFPASASLQTGSSTGFRTHGVGWPTCPPNSDHRAPQNIFDTVADPTEK